VHPHSSSTCQIWCDPPFVFHSSSFLSESTKLSPNPDPAPAKVKLPKSAKSKDSKKASKQKEDFESASSSHAKEEGSTAAATATEEVLEEDATPSPDPIVEAEKPIVLPAPMIPFISSDAELERECLGSRTSTCILALVADSQVGAEIAAHALGSLSEVSHRHKLHKRNLFPFYVLPQSVEGYSKLRDTLKLQHTDVIAINARRGWWRRLPVKQGMLSEGDVSEEAIEAWVDSIRLGEGSKEKLPEGLVPEEPVVEEPVGEEEEAPIVEVEEEKPIILEEVKEDVHDEL